MRPTTRALVEHYVTALDLSGDVLEIGGHRVEATQAAMASSLAALSEQIGALTARLEQVAATVANPPPTDLQRVVRRLRRLRRGPAARR